MRIKLLLVIALFFYAALLLPQKAGAQNMLPCFSRTNYSSVPPSEFDFYPINTLLSADFNGDGYDDLAITANQNGGIIITKGDGKGSLSVIDTITSVYNASNIVSGDFDGDGKPDLAVTDIGNTPYIYILLWNGSVSDFSFRLVDSFLVDSSNPQFNTGEMCSGDFNGDGKADLAVTNYQNYSVSVFISAGGGTFTTTQLDGLSILPNYICSGDFNKDGYDDLATIGQGLEILLWNRNSSMFNSPASLSWGGGEYSAGITSGDFNGDGYDDLAATSTMNSTVFVELWDTVTNFFTTPTGNPFQGGAEVEFICSADFNKDGNADVAVVNDDNAVTVLLGNKNGNLSSPLSFVLNNSPDGQGICSGDFNGDSLPDLAVTSAGGDTSLSVLLNVEKITVTGLDTAYCQNALQVTFSTNPPGVPFSTYGYTNAENTFLPSRVYAAADGRNGPYPFSFQYYYGGCSINTTIDVTINEAPSMPTSISPTIGVENETTIYTQTGGTGTSYLWTVAGGAGSSDSASIAVTWNSIAGATIQAQAVANGCTSTSVTSLIQPITVYKQGTVGINCFSVTNFSVNQLGLPKLTTLLSADFNGDGYTDLATEYIYNGAGSVWILRGDGKGSFSVADTLTFTTGITDIVSADFDNNGSPDLAMTSGAGYVYIALWKGSDSVFSFKTLAPLTAFDAANPPYFVCSGDFDKDGNADLAATNYSNLVVYLGNGLGAFSLVSPPSVTGPGSVCSADFNKDGHADLAVVSNSSSISVFLWSVTGKQFSPAISIALPETTLQFITSGDFNGDAYPDLATVSTQTNNVYLELWNPATNKSFSASTGNPYSVAGTPNSICNADFNKDGNADLAVVGDNQAVTVFPGIKSSSFGAPLPPFQLYTGDVAAKGICSGDFNGDNLPDLAAADSGGLYPLSVLLNQFSEVSFTGLANAYCNNASAVTLTGSPSGGAFLGTAVTNNSFTPSSATIGTDTIIYTYTNVYNCTNTDTQTVIVNAVPPTPVVTAAGPTTFCPGGSVKLSVSNPIANIYIWPQIGDTTTTITAKNSGSYTVYGVGEPGGCISKTSAPVSVKVDSVLVRIDSLHKEYCATSDTIFIHGFPTGGIYTKSLGIQILPSDTVFIPKNARSSNDSVTSIVYKYTDTLGCSNFDTVTVTIYSTPTVELSKLFWCYATDTFALPATIHPTGGTLTFSGANIINNMFIPSHPDTNTIAYQYNYVISGSSQCKIASTPAVLFVDKPNVQFITSLDTAYCLNGPNATLQVSPSPGSFIFSDTTVFHYLDSGKVLFNPSAAVPLDSLRFSYTYTDSNGCTATLKDSTVVNPFPPQPMATSSADSICSGQTLKLTAADAESRLQYKWSGPASYSDTAQNPRIAAIDSTMTGNFSVQAINTYNCVSPSDSVFVFVKPSPPTPLLYIPLTTICNYNYDSAYIKVLSDTAYYSGYTWSLNNQLISGQHQPFLWVPEGGYYTLEVSHTLNNCVTYVDTTLRQTSSPVPVVVGLNAPIDTALFCNTEQAVPLNYQWYVNEKTIIGEESKELTVYYNGVYSVFALYSEGCGEFSATYSVNRYDFSSIARVTTQTDSTIIITPPASGISIVRNGAGANYIVEYTSATNDAITITVTTVTGVTLLEKEVSTKANVRSETPINLDGLAPAMYILNAATSAQSKYVKIIVN